MTTGTIKNNKTGLEIHGDKKGDYSGDFSFVIDGTSDYNYFMTADWTFTPDKEPLPTAIGSLIKFESDLGPYVLTNAGWFYTASFHKMEQTPLSAMESYRNQIDFTIIYDAAKES